MSHKKKTIIAVLAFTTALVPVLLNAQTPNPIGAEGTYSMKSSHEISNQRKSDIEDILNALVEQDKDLNSDTVLTEAETAIMKKMELVPKKPLLFTSMQDLYKEASSTVDKKYEEANYDNRIKNAAMRDAEKKFPLYQKGDKVVVSYLQARYIQKIEGILCAVNAKNIKVNDTTIPLVDMDEKERSKFDPRTNQIMRDRHIKEKLKQYAQKKDNEKQESMEALQAGIDLQNEKNGYIFEPKLAKWITPKEYFATVLPKFKQRSKDKLAAQEKARQEALARAKAKSEAMVARGEVDTSDNSKYNETMERAKKRMEKIYKCSGIDAYPGYGLAVWDIGRTDFAFLFSRKKGLEVIQMPPDCIRIHFETGTPSNVDFFFRPTLNRTEESYGDLSEEKMIELISFLHEKFGQSNEENALGDINVIEKICAGELDSYKLAGKEAPKVDPKKKDATQQEPVPPYLMTWVGKYTAAELEFTYGKLEKEDTFKFLDVRLIKRKLLSYESEAENKTAEVNKAAEDNKDDAKDKEKSAEK